MKLRNLTTSALTVLLMAGCLGDSTGVEVDDLAGTWTATAIVATQTADPFESLDVMALEQATVTLVLGADGTYTLTFTSPQEDPEIESGTFAVVGSTLTLTETVEGSEDFTIDRDGDTMTLTGSDTFEFDPLVGEEAATLVITLTR